MKNLKSILIILFGLVVFSAYTFSPGQNAYAQKKGDLEDFADDHEDDDEDCDCGDSGTGEFFLYMFLNNIGEIARLWGHTPETEFGPFPAHPYVETQGFLTNSDDYRSFFFTTELNYHYLNDDLRAYIFKWETQFVRKSKLSFDFAVYEETIYDNFNRTSRKDHLSFYGFRYGYALYQTPQMILNLEGGVRTLYTNKAYTGPEIALDFQLFPHKPFIFETELAAAYVNTGPIYTIESSVGMTVGRWEILGGMRILKNKSQDMLDGFRFGLRFWY